MTADKTQGEGKKRKGYVDRWIIDFEIRLTMADRECLIVDMSLDDKKVFMSMLLKYYKQGFGTIKLNSK